MLLSPGPQELPEIAIPVEYMDEFLEIQAGGLIMQGW